MNEKKRNWVWLVVLGIVAADQILKIWVKTNIPYGTEIPLIGDWAKLHFIENEGMAYGLTFGGEYGKLALSLFRIVAVTLLFFFLNYLRKKEDVPRGVLLSFAAILAGALGNILDSAFYGLIFSASYPGYLSYFVPFGEGYAPFLHGHVVDMFYFPIWEGTYPEWFPWIGGKDFLFFNPVFNIADAAITSGVFSLLIFHRDFFGIEEDKKEKTSDGEEGNTKEETTTKPVQPPRADAL